MPGLRKATAIDTFVGLSEQYKSAILDVINELQERYDCIINAPSPTPDVAAHVTAAVHAILPGNTTDFTPLSNIIAGLAQPTVAPPYVLPLAQLYQMLEQAGNHTINGADNGAHDLIHDRILVWVGSHNLSNPAPHYMDDLDIEMDQIMAANPFTH